MISEKPIAKILASVFILLTVITAGAISCSALANSAGDSATSCDALTDCAGNSTDSCNTPTDSCNTPTKLLQIVT